MHHKQEALEDNKRSLLRCLIILDNKDYSPRKDNPLDFYNRKVMLMTNTLKVMSIHMQRITITPILEILMTHIIIPPLCHLLAVVLMELIQLGNLAYSEAADRRIRLVDRNLILFKECHLFGINNQPTNLRTGRNKNNLTIKIRRLLFLQVGQDLKLRLSILWTLQMEKMVY